MKLDRQDFPTIFRQNRNFVISICRTQSPFTVHQQMLIHNKEIEKWVKNNNTVGSMLSSPSSWFSVKNVFAHAGGIPAHREQEI